MFKLAIIFGLLAGVQLLPVDEPDVDFRIAGGAPVTIDRAPWQLSLQTNHQPRRHICGASLISANRALTASRCFNIYSRPPGYIVLAGTSTLQHPSGFHTQLERIIYHPRGSTNNALNDLAVLWLLHPAPLGPTIRPIRLPVSNAPIPYGTQALIVGWGLTSNNPSATITNHLKYTRLPIITNEQCNAAYPGRIAENMLCAGGVAGRSACRGDFGGALVVNGVQIGVASWGFCGTVNRPNVFTRISTEVNWIRSVI